MIQGPAELLPVSSSGHLVLVPAMLDWPYARLDADVRKTFEVALHAGAGVAIAWLMREELVADLRDPLGTALLAAPAAVAALAFETVIEERLSAPRIAAVALIAGGAALAVTNRVRALLLQPGRSRVHAYVGLAQAAALVPGVSRGGATLVAGRLAGLSREEALAMSWRAGLPVIGGATLLKAVRLRRRGLERELRAPFAAGAAAAFASTLAAAPLLGLLRRSWAPIGAYRVAFGAVALRRLHRLQWPRG